MARRFTSISSSYSNRSAACTRLSPLKLPKKRTQPSLPVRGTPRRVALPPIRHAASRELCGPNPCWNTAKNTPSALARDMHFQA